MLDTIATHVFDLLQKDARLLDAPQDAAWEWVGVKRLSQGDKDEAGCIHLIEEAYSEAASDERPAVYQGLHNQEMTDQGDGPAIADPRFRTQTRVCFLPLVLVTSVRGGTRRQAKAQCQQLRNNIERILLSHIVESGFWYELTLSEGGGTNNSRRSWSSSTGQGAQGTAEAMLVLPVRIRYTWTLNSPA